MAPPFVSGGKQEARTCGDVGELLAVPGRHHLEDEIGALGSAVEHGQFDSEPVPKVPGDVADDLGPGGRGQTQDRGHRIVARLLPDEAAHVAVVGPEVVSPARQAMRLVEHPAADLALVQDTAQGAGPQLLRRDQQDAGVPQPHPVQGIGTFRHRQQPVDREGPPDFAEEPVQRPIHPLVFGCAEPVPGGKQIRRRPREGLELVPEELQSQTGVKLGIVHLAASETAVLVVLDKVVIGVAGKGERAQTQGVHHRQLQQVEVRLRRLQMGQIEGDQVVPQHEGRALGEVVQPLQGSGQVAARPDLAAAGVRAHRPERANAAVPGDLEVEREAVLPEGEIGRSVPHAAWGSCFQSLLTARNCAQELVGLRHTLTRKTGSMSEDLACPGPAVRAASPK